MASVVPVIDISGDEKEVAAQVRAAATSSGFFYVTGHGIPGELVERQFAQSAAFFALSEKEKLRVSADKNNRGFTRFGEETLDPDHQSQGDTKEGFYIGNEIPADDPRAALPLHGPNQWPDEDILPEFRSVMTEYHTRCSGLGAQIVSLLAASLGLPHDRFASAFTHAMAFLRPLHYGPQVSNPDEGLLAAGAHSDYGMVTILLTDDVPGLQVYVGDMWVDVPPLRGAFIINLGDMLERWTNGLYKSTIHRVVNKHGQERYSTPFFYEPNFDAVVECLPSCCLDRPAAYPPTTAGQHLLDKYAATHADYESQRIPSVDG